MSVLGQQVSVRAHPQIDTGDAALLMVRPEAATLTACTEDAAGVVLAASYLGISVEHEVETVVRDLTPPGSYLLPDTQLVPAASRETAASTDGAS